MAPIWSHSGQELFHVTLELGGEAPKPQLVAAGVDTRENFRILPQDTLFAIPPDFPASPYISLYDVTEDGQRFLMFRCVDGDCQPGDVKYHVVENFDQEALRRMVN